MLVASISEIVEQNRSSNNNATLTTTTAAAAATTSAATTTSDTNTNSDTTTTTTATTAAAVDTVNTADTSIIATATTATAIVDDVDVDVDVDAGDVDAGDDVDAGNDVTTTTNISTATPTTLVDSLTQLVLERLSSISTTIGSQQEANELLNDIKSLIEKYSNDRLSNVIAPALVVVQKGRSKNTKREKIALEHQADALKIERKKKVEEMKSVEEKKMIKGNKTVDVLVKKRKSKEGIEYNQSVYNVCIS